METASTGFLRTCCPVHWHACSLLTTPLLPAPFPYPPYTLPSCVLWRLSTCFYLLLPAALHKQEGGGGNTVRDTATSSETPGRDYGKRRFTMADARTVLRRGGALPLPACGICVA